MEERIRVRPVDEEMGTVGLEPPEGGPLQDEDGAVDLNQAWPSLHVILEALDVTTFLEDRVDAAKVAEIGQALEPYTWDALFEERIIEEDDLPDDPENVARYYEKLRNLAILSSDQGVGWETEAS